MANSILHGVLKSVISTGMLDQLGGRIGLSPQQTRQVVPMAVGALVSGLSHEASDPNRAAGLQEAIAEDHDGSVLDNLKGYMAAPHSEEGEGILGHVFGDQLEPVEKLAAEQAGVRTAQVAPIMSALAPVVLGAVGKAVSQQGLDMSKLGQLLGNEQKQAAQIQPDIVNQVGHILKNGG